MANSSNSDPTFEALLVAAGLRPNPRDLEELRAAYPSLCQMKERVRAASRWDGEPAHVFSPDVDNAAIVRAPSAMSSIAVPSGSHRGDD